MKYKGQQQSRNIEDRRGRRPSAGAGKLVGSKGGKFGIGTIIIALIAIFVFKQDPNQVIGDALNNGGSAPATQSAPNRYSDEAYAGTKQEEELKEFLGVVLKETEDVWNQVLPEQAGKRYIEPTLVIYANEVQSACGRATKAVGPFYCSGDNKLYIDLSFQQDLEKRFGAKGDFAMAYVVAHEVAHHVQNLMGATRYVHGQKNRVPQAEYNQLSVRLELQADFYAGLWARYTNEMTDLIEHGDIDEALNTAFAIGDDRIQMMGRGSVIPESFTHGTSEQRMRWFRKGYETGRMSEGDTFGARSL